MNFTWDNAKALTNIAKHGVTFEVASQAFEDDFSATFPDPDSSFSEERLILYGLARNSQLLVVSYTERSDGIRIISARIATNKERKRYEA